MFRQLTLPVLLGVFALQVAPSPAAAQDGEFARQYPEAAALLDAVDASHAALIEQLYSGANSVDAVEGRTYNQLLSRIQAADDESTSSLRDEMPSFTKFAPQIAEIIDRTRALRRSIYDIYADAGVTDKHSAVGRAVDEYLSQPDVALPATPKSLVPGPTGTDGSTGLSAPGQMAGMAMADMDMGDMDMPGMDMDMPGMDMEGDHNESMAFRQNFPKTNGLMWASTWLQIGLSDPLLYYTTPDARKAGVETAVQHFTQLLADAPNNFPMAQPTPPAISPALLSEYPRAAAIFGNLNLLNDLVKDILVDPAETDKAAALTLAVRHIQDPREMAITQYDWTLMSLRQGIYFQGGPAIGTLERSERNGGHSMSMPMSTMGN